MKAVPNTDGDRHLNGELVLITERYVQNHLARLNRDCGWAREFDGNRPAQPWEPLDLSVPANVDELGRRCRRVLAHSDQSVQGDSVTHNIRRFFIANFEEG
jgi:hypothetical protein